MYKEFLKSGLMKIEEGVVAELTADQPEE